MIYSHLYHLSMAAGICIGWRLGQWLVQQLDLLGAFGVDRQSLGRLGAQFREFGQGGGGVRGRGEQMWGKCLGVSVVWRLGSWAGDWAWGWRDWGCLQLCCWFGGSVAGQAIGRLFGRAIEQAVVWAVGQKVGREVGN